MCGLLGLYGEVSNKKYLFNESLKLQANRGPDNQSVLEFPHALLGHARLSIHDLSESANQPMEKSNGRYSLLFNGEIYNFRELKKDIPEKYHFYSDSDTEVLMFYLIEYGVKKTLNSIEGMFAFSFYDKATGEVIVARDEYGEKPLYYQLDDGSLSVSSSLYSLIFLNGFDGLNSQAVSNFLHYGYTKGRYTAAQGVEKVAPSSYLKFNVYSTEFSEHHFSREKKVVIPDSITSLDQYIKSSINLCLDSDVPVGCFLSGGIDSSLIASYVAELNPSLVAFTIGFQDEKYDESTNAEVVAQHLGIKIKKKILSDSDLLTLVDDTKFVFDEPFADASFLATYALCKFAKRDVTVCLSGDAGDELFSGYNRHALIPKIYSKTHKIPYFFRQLISKALLNSHSFRSLLGFLYKAFILKGDSITAINEKIDKLGSIIAYRDKSDLLYRVLAGNDYSSQIQFPQPYKHKIDSLSSRSLSLLDLYSYLHEDVLTKVDRCSMAASIEARVPLLNKNIVDFARYSSDDLHILRGNQKTALKRLLSEKLPKDIIERPKSGFSVPYQRIIESHLKGKFKKYEVNLQQKLPIQYKECKYLFILVDKYYKNKFYDYKFIWNIFFFIQWLDNVATYSLKAKQIKLAKEI
jgi:asparagine synthase (glutamine-hydrolysing)